MDLGYYNIIIPFGNLRTNFNRKYFDKNSSLQLFIVELQLKYKFFVEIPVFSIILISGGNFFIFDPSNYQLDLTCYQKSLSHS